MEATVTLPGELRMAVLRLSRRLRQEAVGQITPSKLAALSSISAYGPISLGELAVLERVAPPSMTRIAAGLEDLGLVARRSDAADRRVARLGITDAGAALLDETRTRRDAYLAQRLQGFTDAERAAIADVVPLLARLAQDER